MAGDAMNDEPFDKHHETFEEHLIDRISDWAADQDWGSTDELSSIIAITNSIFTEDYIDDIKIEQVEEGEILFTCEGVLHGIPRKDDVPFCGDTINFTATGAIGYDDSFGDWFVSDDVDVTGELADWVSDPDQQEMEWSSEFPPEEPSTSLIQEHQPGSPDDLISYISNLTTSLWFRGHADKSWALETGIARQTNASLSLEKMLRLAFENQTTFLDPASHPLGTAKSNFLMQHHGLPTRLLDWSASPLTALYFAVCDPKHDDKDACLWVLDPSQLNTRHKESFPFECDGGSDEIFTEDTNRALAIHAPYTNLRMKLQQSEFTLHTFYAPLEKELGAEQYIKQKIIVRKQFKSVLREKLLSLGVTRGTLFPDLDNIAQTIKDNVLEVVT
jgi:FRG domain